MVRLKIHNRLGPLSVVWFTLLSKLLGSHSVPSSPQRLPNGALEFDLVLSNPSAFRGTRQNE